MPWDPIEIPVLLHNESQHKIEHALKVAWVQHTPHPSPLLLADPDRPERSSHPREAAPVATAPCTVVVVVWISARTGTCCCSPCWRCPRVRRWCRCKRRQVRKLAGPAAPVDLVAETLALSSAFAEWQKTEK